MKPRKHWILVCTKSLYSENICNKTASCSYKVTVSGTKKPVCHAEVTWVMSSDGMAEVWAK